MVQNPDYLQPNLFLTFKIQSSLDLRSPLAIRIQNGGHFARFFKFFPVFDCNDPVLGSSLYCFERVPLDICSENRKFKIMTKLEKILAKS